MTLKYKLLGIPGEFHEFLDKLEKNGIDLVVIRAEPIHPIYGLLSPSSLVFEDSDGKIRYKERARDARDLYIKAQGRIDELRGCGFKVKKGSPLSYEEWKKERFPA